MTDPSVETLQVTPQLAKDWLNQNENNRRLRPGVVDAYARQMRNGRWPFTGEPIQRDVNGNLINGQHRLSALVEAGVTLPFVVVSGLPPEVADVVDTQARRSAGDMLERYGELHTRSLGSAVRIALLQEQGALSTGGQTQIGHTEIRAFIDYNPDIRDAVSLALRVYRGMDAPSPAALAYAIWRLRRIDRERADQFFIDASEKANLGPNDPALALARRFAEIRRTKKRTPVEEQLTLIYRAWNARRKGRTLAMVKAVHNGQRAQTPEPI